MSYSFSIVLCTFILFINLGEGFSLGMIRANTEEDTRTDEAPKIQYWHNYNKNGKSAWANCTFSHLKPHTFIPGVQPFYTETTNSVNTTIISQTLLWVDANYSASWHNDPHVQLNVFTSGHGLWTVEDEFQGEFKSIEFGPGDFYLGDDHGTKGHKSKTVGGQPMVILTTQFNRSVSDVNNPCWL